MTYAWSAGQWDHRAQLQQYENGQELDRDRSKATDFGQWRYGSRTAVIAYVDQFEGLELDERTVAVDYVRALKHPVLEKERVTKDLVKLIKLRKDIWRAAVKGIDPNGKLTEKGWDKLDRTKRYKILLHITQHSA